MLRASHAFVQAIVGVGTVIIVFIGVTYTGGGEYFAQKKSARDDRRLVQEMPQTYPALVHVQPGSGHGLVANFPLRGGVAKK